MPLADPSAALGSEASAAAVLREAGFVEITVVADRVLLSGVDLSSAWESNLRSAAHRAVRTLPSETLETLRFRFEQALGEARRGDPSFAVADVLYAFGGKPADPQA